jgi:hypothetical protein
VTAPAVDPVNRWAADEAGTLASTAQDVSKATGTLSSIRHLLTPSLETLRRHASGTEFETMARVIAESTRMSASTGLVQMSDLLYSWVSYRRSDVSAVDAPAVRARVDAATDLMEQVQTLLDDPRVHAAAPVMLAGAALEELLRSLVLGAVVQVKGKPGLQAYAEALKTYGTLTAQDVKDVTAWAGQRNDAAHGLFEGMTRTRAQIMADGINLFMRQKSAVTTP